MIINTDTIGFIHWISLWNSLVVIIWLQNLVFFLLWTFLFYLVLSFFLFFWTERINQSVISFWVLQWDDSFTTYEHFISYSLIRTRTCGRNVSFSENFAYQMNYLYIFYSSRYRHHFNYWKKNYIFRVLFGSWRQVWACLNDNLL